MKKVFLFFYNNFKESMIFNEFDILEIEAKGEYSEYCLSRGISDFGSLLRLVQNFDYGRNSNKENLFLVMEEERGTCGTKHAFMYELIKEQGWPDWELVLGVYIIDCENTVEACYLLEQTELFEVPNAHTYLKYKSDIIDATKIGSEGLAFKARLMSETKIDSNQIGVFKTELHRKFIKRWMGDNELGCTLSFDRIWGVREKIIEILSEKS